MMRHFARLADALTDPARRNRAMIGLLIAYVIVWTIYGVLAKSGQDLHVDMTEIVGWSREFAFGYPKHPPLASYLARIWFAAFPLADWSYYLFAMLFPAVTLWIAWRAGLRLLDARKALAATLLLTFIPFFTFHALKFNANTVLMPLWAATALWFLISYETRSRFYAVLAGIGAAGAMLGKYWSIFLLLGLGLAALIDSRRGEYFKSAAPYLTILSGAFVLAPHVVWLVRNDFAPIKYASTLHGSKPFEDALYAAGGYLVGSFGYALIAVALVALFFRPSPRAVQDTFLPKDRDRRFVALVFWLPLLLPALIAPLIGTTLNSLWSISAWALFGIVLLGSPLTDAGERATVRLLALAMIAPVALAIAAPAIAYNVQRNVAPWQTHTSLLGTEIDKAWREATNAPLKIVCGDAGLAYGAAFYSQSRPMVCDDLTAFAAGGLQRDAAMNRDGVLLICFDNVHCEAGIDQTGRGATGMTRRTLTLSRRFMGMDGTPERYLIAVIPPQK